MNEALDPAAVARHPTQQRAKDRFERIVQTAEVLLGESGLSGFSIPDIAERLHYTRGSVYAYFPTPYALLNELAQRHLAAIEAVFYARADELRNLSWKDGIGAVVDIAVEYHNGHPVARLLILGGAVTDESYRAQEQTSKRLGELGRQMWSPLAPLPAQPVDVTTLLVEIGMTCMRRSFLEHGKITAEYRDAAVSAMTCFLQPYVSTAAASASGA